MVLPARTEQVESTFRSMFRDLTGFLAWIYTELEGRKLTLRIAWVLPSYADCPGYATVTPARTEFQRLWAEPKVVGFWRDDRTVVLDGIRLAESAFLVNKKAPTQWKMWDILPGHKSLPVPHP